MIDKVKYDINVDVTHSSDSKYTDVIVIMILPFLSDSSILVSEELDCCVTDRGLCVDFSD